MVALFDFEINERRGAMIARSDVVCYDNTMPRAAYAR